MLSRQYDRLEYAISRGPAVCDVNYLQLVGKLNLNNEKKKKCS